MPLDSTIFSLAIGSVKLLLQYISLRKDCKLVNNNGILVCPDRCRIANCSLGLPLGEEVWRGKDQRTGANNEHSRRNVLGLGGHFPASEVGQDLRLKCNTDSAYATCMWLHEIDGERDSQNQQLRVACSGMPTHNGDTCANTAGSQELSSYASRIKFETSPTSCGLRVSRAEPRDTGKWKCTMISADMVPVYSEIDVFVSNQSKLYITEPDLRVKPNEVVKYTVGDSSSEIEATCTGYGGNPEPEFHWYVGDDRNEILKVDSSRRISSQDQWGKFVSQQIIWRPSREDMCKYDDLRNYCYSDQFTFNLICKVVQKTSSKTYYQNENSQDMAEVTVEVRSSATWNHQFSFVVASLVSILITKIVH